MCYTITIMYYYHCVLLLSLLLLITIIVITNVLFIFEMKHVNWELVNIFRMCVSSLC